MQPGHRRVDATVRVKRALEIVAVELHAESHQVAILFAAQLGHGKPADRFDIGEIAADLGQVALRDLANVLAVVAVFGKRRLLAQQFLGARTHRDREILDLLARIVVIELARHRKALRREQAADRIAQRRLPAMADVQRTGRVGGHEFDHHRFAQVRARQAERVELGEHPRDNRLPRRRRQHDVDEARAGDVDALDELRSRGARQPALPQVAADCAVRAWRAPVRCSSRSRRARPASAGRARRAFRRARAPRRPPLPTTRARVLFSDRSRKGRRYAKGNDYNE